MYQTEKQKTNTEIIIERRDIPPPICAVYYHPILVIASHLSRGDAIEIQEIFNKKAPAINSGFNWVILKKSAMWEAEDETEWIQNELGDRYPEFERTVQEKGCYPALDILREIDPAAYQRILDDMAFQIENYDAPEWAQGKFDQKIAELKEEL